MVDSRSDDVLEVDELWAFVGNKWHPSWLWLALCRRTRQVVAFYLGPRTKQSCLSLWQRIPWQYQHCYSYSDYLESYKTIFGTKKHFQVGKESGEVNHLERLNNTIRQRLCRYVRKTLSFSKSQEMHYLYTKLFLTNYNLSVIS